MAGWCYLKSQSPNPRSQSPNPLIGIWDLGFGIWDLAILSRRRPAPGGRALCLEQLLGLRELRQRKLELRIGLREIFVRGGHAEEIDVDLLLDHRFGKRQVLLPGSLVPLDRRLLRERLELGNQRVGHDEIRRQRTR